MSSGAFSRQWVLVLAAGLGAVGCNFGSTTSGSSPDASFDFDSGSSPELALLSASALTEGFGDVQMGTQSPASSLVITNTGGGASGALSVALGGTDAASFHIDSDGCSGHALAPGDTCTISTHFAPGSVGAESASLTVHADPGGSVAVALSGNGKKPAAVAFSLATQSFGTVATGSSSAPTQLTLANSGGSDTGKLTVSLGGTDASAFTLSSDGCSGKPLAAGAQCTVDVSFAPATVGANSATLTAGDSGAASATAALTGTGATPAAFAVSPASYDFGSLTVGAASAAQAFTVTNSGGVPSAAPTVAASGTDSADFTVASTCAAALQPAATCTFTVLFKPSHPGAEGPVTVTVSGASTTSASTKLTGTGLSQAAITITPASNPFGTYAWTTTSADVPFTVTNTGGTPTGPLAVSLAGTYAGQFALGAQSDCSGATLAAGTGTCTVYVHFAPVSPATGSVQASLNVNGSPGGTAAATLTGDAEPPAALAFDAGNYGFGSPTVGKSSSPVTLKLVNSGGVPSGTPGAPSITGANPTDFVVATNNCTAPIAPAGSCTMSVVFTPKTTKAESATISATATPGGTATATLQGTGLTTASLAITPNPGLFVATTQGKTSAAVTFTVKNSGQTASGAPGAPTFTTGNSTDFAVVAGSSTCTAAIAPNGGTCKFDVTFTPKTTSAETTTLGIDDGAGHTAAGTLNGTGLTKATLAITPNPGVFPPTTQNVASAPVTFTVKNSGQTDSATPATPTFTTGNSTDFAVVAGVTNTCTGPIAKNGGTCAFEVIFTPKTTAAETTTLGISDGAGATASDTLQGTGVTPVASITLSPASPYAFPAILANPNTPSSKTFTVKNTGTAATSGLKIQGVVAPYALANDGCTNTVVAKNGGTCSFDIHFDPTAPGASSDAITVVDTASDTQPLAISGVGLCAGTCVVIEPNPADFGTVTYPSTRLMTFSATNYGGSPSGQITNLYAGGNFPYFTTAIGSCGTVLTAYPNSTDTCSFTMTFVPPSTGHGQVNQPNYEEANLVDATGASVATGWLYFAW